MAINKSKIRWGVLLIAVIVFVTTIDWLTNRYHYNESAPHKKHPCNTVK